VFWGESLIIPRYNDRLLNLVATRKKLPMNGLWNTLLLLIGSNIFMTFAWYGHLKNKELPLWKAVLMSWGIAFFEYLLMIPANRLGYQVASASQLKIMQEAITLVIFVGFAVLYLKEPLRWNMLVSLGLVGAAVFFAFHKWE
jgi:uncharacterized protein (DUF486 family)